MKKMTESNLYEMMYKPTPTKKFWRGFAYGLGWAAILWVAIGFSSLVLWGVWQLIKYI